MGLIGDILSPITGAIQSGIEAKTSRRNVDMTISANKNMAEYQYSKDLEMWNRANEYNSPSSQMSRYTSAGLNPNLIYGTGTASAGNTATTLPKYQAPTVEYNYSPPINIAGTIGAYQDFQMKQAQIDNLKEQKKILASESLMKAIDAYWYENYLDGNVRGVGKSNAILKESQADYATGNLRLLKEKIKNTELANELRNKDVNWYIWNRLGSAAVRSISSLAKSGVKKGLAAAPKTRPWPINPK